MGVLLLRSVVFRFKESPKYLVYRGHDEKAIRVLEHVAEVNGRVCELTLADFEALDLEDASHNSAGEQTTVVVLDP